MNKKNIVVKENIEKLANFLKTAADDYKLNDSDGCYNFKLSDDLVLAVGWSDGYDMEDTDIIKSEHGQRKNGSWTCGWAVNAAIKVRNDYDCTEYDYLDFPVWNDTEECADTSVSMLPNETRRGYRNLAKYFLKEFVAITNAHKKGLVRYE